jgi:hypothetical protein
MTTPARSSPTVDPMATDTDLRCSSQARDAQLDPLGTAVSAPAFALVEVPLPWPRDVADHPLVGVAVAGLPAGTRVQAVLRAAAPADGDRPVTIVYEHDGGPFRRYRRRGPGPTDGEVLVCTHGTRDRCCGSLGTSLALALTPAAGWRVHRTSHLGGHRFAPTALVLPQGTAWAWLDAGLLTAVLERSRPVADLRAHYRGSTAMAAPALQLAEGAVFAEVGWSWLDETRSGTTVAAGPDRWEVRIESTAGDWEAVVERLGTVPQPVCGGPPPPGGKTDDVLRLVELRSVR